MSAKIDPAVAADLYRSGLSLSEVGKRFGATGGAVLYILKRDGVPRRPVGTVKPGPAPRPCPVGARFASLTVLGPSAQSLYGDRSSWNCQCDCGAPVHADAGRVRRGIQVACETCSRSVHGLSRTREYTAWKGMIARCHNPKDKAYADYGARGISVFPAWHGPAGLRLFIDHMGPRPTTAHSIDRIDNDRGYEPGNVRWATPLEQTRNRRTTKLVTFHGETIALGALAERTGIPYRLLLSRIDSGLSAEAAVSAKPRYRAGSRQRRVA